MFTQWFPTEAQDRAQHYASQVWLWINTFFYGIFKGMNIHLAGVQGFDPLPVTTICIDPTLCVYLCINDYIYIYK